MSKMRGYISPAEYADRAIMALENAIDTDATIKAFRVPIRELLRETRMLRTRSENAERRADLAEAKAAQAAQPVGVPVGWAKEYGRETLVSWSKEAPEHGKGWWPLYTQPPAQPSADAEELDNYRWLKRCTAGQWDALNDSRLHGRLDETVKAARAKEKGE